jgi:hypothetical protein
VDKITGPFVFLLKKLFTHHGGTETQRIDL